MISDISDEPAKTLFEEAGDALFLIEPQSDRLVATNTAAERLTRFSRSDLLKMPATYWFRFADQAGKDWLREATNSGGVVHFQDGYFLRTQEIAAWIPVNLTISRLNVQSQPGERGIHHAIDDEGRRFDRDLSQQGGMKGTSRKTGTGSG
jgi:PAS domain-containing protein